MGTLWIIRGLPGSGKTSLATFLENCLPDAIAVSADDFMLDPETKKYKFNADLLPMVHFNCCMYVKRHMETKAVHILVHNTFTTEQEIKKYTDLADAYSYSVQFLVVENRHGGVSEHNVPEHTIERMRERFSLKL